MSDSGFSLKEMDINWKKLIELGPRFMGTENERKSIKFLLDILSKTTATITEHDFSYSGWSLLEPPTLEIISPSYYAFPCEVFMYCPSTPLGGITGTIEFIGIHRVIDCFDWMQFEVIDENDKVVGYISGRPDGQAIPQPFGDGNALKPHFIIGNYELAKLNLWLERGLKIEVRGIIKSILSPEAKSKNIIASFNTENPNRIGLCAHYDSVYSSPGANDNAASVCSLLAIAEWLTKSENNHPVDLFFFGGEEWGLLGSKTYVKDQIEKHTLNNLKLLVNVDGVSEGSSLSISVGPEALGEALREIIKQFPLPRKINKIYRFPPGKGSDHVPFYQAGIPICSLLYINTLGVYKYHSPEDNYCPEGLENILFTSELCKFIIQEFPKLNQPWNGHSLPKGFELS